MTDFRILLDIQRTCCRGSHPVDDEGRQGLGPIEEQAGGIREHRRPMLGVGRSDQGLTWAWALAIRRNAPPLTHLAVVLS